MRPWEAMGGRSVRPWEAVGGRSVRPWEAVGGRSVRPWEAMGVRARPLTTKSCDLSESPNLASQIGLPRPPMASHGLPRPHRSASHGLTDWPPTASQICLSQ